MDEEAFKFSGKSTRKWVAQPKGKPKEKVSPKESGETPVRDMFLEHLEERSKSLSDYEQNIDTLTDVIGSKDFLDTMLSSKLTFRQAIEQNKYAAAFLSNDNSKFEKLIDTLGESFEYVHSEAIRNSRNTALGKESKSNADIFAQTMGEHLNKVRDEGHTTMRSIAERFNKLGVKSARGYDWSHTTVNQLIKRRKALGLETDTKDAGLDMD
ncbi:recombinase [Maribacter spongiicola]|uniref:Recombinase n=1 Tax=Maribacter spongiicola TaxID=1206753 RepID=A0A4R7JYQ1_9FLAO|nr:recombinase family protein [Maribacter spongiicola]TDT43652.1 recombinase [Maribacter spongiicola]